MNIFCFINLLLSRNHFVILTLFFSHLPLSFYFLLFFTYLSYCIILLNMYISFYNHLFIYIPCIHSDEGLQSKTSVPKCFSLQCKTYQFYKTSSFTSLHFTHLPWLLIVRADGLVTSSFTYS